MALLDWLETKTPPPESNACTPLYSVSFKIQQRVKIMTHASTRKKALKTQPLLGLMIAAVALGARLP